MSFFSKLSFCIWEWISTIFSTSLLFLRVKRLLNNTLRSPHLLGKAHLLRFFGTLRYNLVSLDTSATLNQEFTDAEFKRHLSLLIQSSKTLYWKSQPESRIARILTKGLSKWRVKVAVKPRKTDMVSTYQMGYQLWNTFPPILGPRWKISDHQSSICFLTMIRLYNAGKFATHGPS